jgi:methylphosphotriester-DNA--protein-cysteine methyltransferase
MNAEQRRKLRWELKLMPKKYKGKERKELAKEKLAHPEPMKELLRMVGK